MENNKIKPESGMPADSKGGKKTYNKRYHHGKNQGKAQRSSEAAERIKQEDAASAEAASTPSAKQGSAQGYKSNKGKKHQGRSSQPRRPAQEALGGEKTAEAEPQASAQSRSRARSRDRQRDRDNAPLMTELPENELNITPSRSKNGSDFLFIGDTDDSYIDSMPLDPTLDAVFGYVPPVEETVTDGPEIIGIRFEHGSKVYYFDPKENSYSVGDHAIVETAQGLEFGEVVIANRRVAQDQIVAPLRPAINRATAEDEAHHEDNRRRQNEAFKICLTKIEEHGLDMKLVDCQYTFDNTKLIFFFTSAGRVDFRALVKDLASIFRTRIELRQIGIRDEARMIGGFGVCGRKLCCAGFLPNFVQVSIKMAKEQGLSINAAKISGTCGRLMCCLRYEQEAYERELALMPPVDSIVDTPDGRGVVIDIFPISGNLKVKLKDKEDAAPKSYHMSTIRIISKAETKKSDALEDE